MKKQNIIQFLKFGLFSISAGAIQLGAFALMYDILHIYYWISHLTALILSVLWNFTFNRKFTFKSASNIPFAMFLVALFYCVFTPLSTWWGSAMESVNIPGVIVEIFTMLVNFVTEFFYQKYIVFKDLNKHSDSFDKIMKILKTPIND